MIRIALHISESTTSCLRQRAINVFEIESASREYNQINSIDGALAHDETYFFHIIEGDSSAVDILLKKIALDRRNDKFRVVLDAYHENKLYDSWEMLDGQSDKQSKLFKDYLILNIDSLLFIDEVDFDIVEKFADSTFY